MYIRRKVFSVAIDENGEEKLFSTTEIMSEESYLEKAYAEAEAEKKSSTGKKVAVGAGATAAAGAGGIYGASKLGKYLADPAKKDKVIDAAMKNKEVTDEQFKKILAKQVKKEKAGEMLQKPAAWIAKNAKKLVRK